MNIQELILKQENELNEKQVEFLNTHEKILTCGSVIGNTLLDLAINLKKMKDEKLFVEAGFDTFEDYSEQACGLKRRQAYNYIKILDSFVDFAVNQFILNREYCEFIELLKMYINSKEPGTGLVHLIYVNDESILLDDHKNIISLTHNNLDLHYLSDISFSSNDYALNSLLNLLPKKLYIHLIDDYIDEFVNTLTLIFDKKVVLCTDCNICHLYKHSPLHFSVRNKE